MVPTPKAFGVALAHDLGVGRHALGHSLLHFFRRQAGDGAVLFVPRTPGLEWATFALRLFDQAGVLSQNRKRFGGE